MPLLCRSKILETFYYILALALALFGLSRLSTRLARAPFRIGVLCAAALACFACVVLYLFFAAQYRADPTASLLTLPIVCATILIVLFFPHDFSYSPYLLGACFQACFLLVLTIASFLGITRQEHSAASMCLDIARFVFPISVGTFVGILLSERPQISLGITALLLLLVIVQIILKHATFRTKQFSGRDFGLDRQLSVAQQLAIVEDSKPENPALLRERACQELIVQFVLTTREAEVLHQLAKGSTLPHIAQTLFLSENTVKGYRSSLYAKLGIHKRQDLLNMLDQYEM